MPTLLPHWPWPAICEICARWPAEPVCPACQRDHARPSRRCPGCALPLAPGLERCIRCVEAPASHLSSCLARVAYAFPWVEVVAQFKFQQQPAWGRHLANLMVQQGDIQALLNQVDWIAPIPLPPSRLLERGYNQAWELVKQLRRHAPASLVTVPDLLLRKESRYTQHSLGRAERLEHARRAFHLNPDRQSGLSGQKVLLVDDVMTTGATLEAAASVLLACGAAEVHAVVFARTPPPDTDKLRAAEPME